MKKRKKKKSKNNTKAQNNQAASSGGHLTDFHYVYKISFGESLYQAELKPGKNGKLKNNLKSITENVREKIADLCCDIRFILLMFFLLMEIILIGIMVITDKICNEAQEQFIEEGKQYIEEGYTVYIDGQEVDPDKIGLENYYDSLVYDTEKKRIYIAR